MKIKRIIPLLVLIMLFNVLSCSDENVSDTKINDSSEIDALVKRQSGARVDATQVGCGASFSGSYVPNGYYTYPDKVIDLCATAGGTITVNCTAMDVPNRFTIYDASGSTVASTGWMGYTSNSGPWGSSLSGPYSKSVSFTKTTSASYKIRVETVVQGISDAWDVSVSCSNVCVVVPPCVTSCSTFLSGNYTGNGYYTYPDKTLNFCTTAAGKTISIFCQSVEVPNRFTVYDANGTYIASSGWIGYASTSGPWGQSINGPGSVTLSFPKNTNTYTLRVETVRQGNSDAWEASIGCQP